MSAKAPSKTPSSVQVLAFDVEAVRKDFPILKSTVHGHPLVYLDNAATSQKPLAVLRALDSYYKTTNSNIHRGVHFLSEKATQAYENARGTVGKFLNAADAREIVFVRGATEGINLVAQAWGRMSVKAGDEILVTTMEHHSNIVPWQMLCGETGAVLKVVPMDDEGNLMMAEFEKLLSPKTKLLAVTQVSNALGTVNPVKDMIRAAHAKGAKVLVDAAQAVPHFRVDVRELDVDFLVLSGHKVYGPTGIGVLYGKHGLLDAMKPYQGGGEMIASVTFEGTTYKKPPHKFEAGTPHIAGTIGLAAALDYLSAFDPSALASHEADLMEYATSQLSSVPGLKIVGRAPHKAGALSFTLGEIHPHDIGTILDRQGVAIRAGHHCAQPVMDRLGIPATARASFALYNTRGEVDALVKAVQKVSEIFK